MTRPLVLVVLFAAVYVALGVDFGDSATWVTPIYFSVVTLTTLGKHPLILPPPDRPHRVEITGRLRTELGRDPEVSVETGGWELMMLYASLGLGVAVVNDFCTPPKGATALAISGLAHLEYRLIERKEAQLPPLAEELKRHLLGK